VGLSARHESPWARGDARLAGAATDRRASRWRRQNGHVHPRPGEIEAGIQQVNQPDAYRLNLDRLLRQVTIWPVDRFTAEAYGVIHCDLKRRGRVLSQVDMMLAALARQMKLTLVTTDHDFAALPDVPTENWLNRAAG